MILLPNLSVRAKRMPLGSLVRRRLSPLFAAAFAAALATPVLAQNEKAAAPIPDSTLALMAAKNTDAAAPILVRSYKKEAELEVWKRAKSGRYVLLKSFPICRWSGQLGPKRSQGDRQTPEGFYSIARRQMNPNSHYYLSFDTGFPNAYDKAHSASGAYLMVHGTCSSAGCYAMTDTQIGEIYAIAREALAGGQQAFQFQAYPFRMSAQNMAKYRSDKNIDFWRQLKEGSDRFEATGEEPVVSVAAGRYAFAPSANPMREAAAKAFHAQEEARIATLVADGSAAIRTTYSDGGQHPAFATLLKQGANLGDVSRPEALAFAGQEVVLIPARPKKKVQIAELEDPVASQADSSEPTAGACIALPIRSIGPEDLLFSSLPLGCGRSKTISSLAVAPGAMRILPPAFTPSTLEVAASR
ncbi:MAG: murein L,D-transpeptidase [Beijerinckiaceae bacterium]